MRARDGLLFYLGILILYLSGSCLAQNPPSDSEDQPALGGLPVQFSSSPDGPPQSKVDQAYEYNRAGMINMSMARFEEAIEEFRKAAALLPDYQIRGSPLLYTPIFMTAWAYEKIGRLNEACDHYRKFLEIAPPEVVEESKAQHAREVLDQCRH